MTDYRITAYRCDCHGVWTRWAQGDKWSMWDGVMDGWTVAYPDLESLAKVHGTLTPVALAESLGVRP